MPPGKPKAALPFALAAQSLARVAIEAAKPESVNRVTPPRGRKVQRGTDKPVMYPQMHDFERAKTGGRQQNSAGCPIQPVAVMDQLMCDGNREQGAECSD